MEKFSTRIISCWVFFSSIFGLGLMTSRETIGMTEGFLGISMIASSILSYWLLRFDFQIKENQKQIESLQIDLKNTYKNLNDKHYKLLGETFNSIERLHERLNEKK